MKCNGSVAYGAILSFMVLKWRSWHFILGKINLNLLGEESFSEHGKYEQKPGNTWKGTDCVMTEWEGIERKE